MPVESLNGSRLASRLTMEEFCQVTTVDATLYKRNEAGMERQDIIPPDRRPAGCEQRDGKTVKRKRPHSSSNNVQHRLVSTLDCQTDVSSQALNGDLTDTGIAPTTSCKKANGASSSPSDNCLPSKRADLGDVEGGLSDSELITAAYNNFVRRIIDDTLDRNVTFCEQPRHAISALEAICAKAWPSLEVKRHRNRIRAYLKACRRNSKKNQGHISMKEPPMNGLSLEARQMVSQALGTVACEVEQLRKSLGHTGSSSIDMTLTGKLQYQPSNSPPRFTEPHSQSPNHKQLTKPSDSRYRDRRRRDRSSTSPNTSNDLHLTVNQRSRLQSFLPFLTSHPCLSTFMRLIPGSNNNPSNDRRYIDGSSSSMSTPGRSIFITNGHQSSPPPINTSHDIQQTKANYLSGSEKPELADPVMEAGPFSDTHFEQLGYSRLEPPPPPPAHCNSIRYSGSLQEATAKILDAQIFSQADLEYFQANRHLAKEAIENARRMTRWIVQKSDLLESYMNRLPDSTFEQPIDLCRDAN